MIAASLFHLNGKAILVQNGVNLDVIQLTVSLIKIKIKNQRENKQMKKKISYVILFSLFLVSCFAYDEIQWKTTKDLYNVPVLSPGGHWSQEDIRQDTLLKTSNKSGVFYNGYDAGFRDDFYVSAELENAEVCLPLDSVVNVTCKVQLLEALISGKTKPKYVDEITLQSFFSNRKQLIKQTYPNGVTNAEDEYFPWETLLEINGGDLYLSNVYVKLSNSFNFGFSKFFIKDMEMIDEKTYKFECICEDFYHPDSKYKIEKEAIAMLYAEIDGDYIKVFLFDTENLFKIYARINKETEHELNSYFETGLCNLSKVTWPRHADGTCDYEDENGNVKTGAGEDLDMSVTAVIQKPAPDLGKTAVVTENLRLRTDDKTMAEVVTTLVAGARVKVEAIGKEETIDGITSNWVQVSVFDSAKDKDGNAIEAGTKGWLFGGYLTTTEYVEPVKVNLLDSVETKDERKANRAGKMNKKEENEDFVFPFIQVGFGIILIIVLFPIILSIAKKRKTKKND